MYIKKRFVLILLLFMMLFVVAGCLEGGTPPPDSGPGTVKGKIEGLTVGKAVVDLGKDSISSNGEFEIDDLSLGRAHLEIEVDRCVVYDQPIEVQEDTEVNIAEEDIYEYIYDEYDFEEYNGDVDEDECIEVEGINDFVEIVAYLENMDNVFSENISAANIESDTEWHEEVEEIKYEEPLGNIFFYEPMSLVLRADVVIEERKYGVREIIDCEEWSYIEGFNLGVGYEELKSGHYMDGTEAVDIWAEGLIEHYLLINGMIRVSTKDVRLETRFEL